MSKIPKDLKRFSVKCVLKRVIPCILGEIVLGIILFLWGDRIFMTDITEFKISCYIVVMCIPFVLTGVPFELFDRTFFGKVNKVKVESELTSTGVSAVEMRGSKVTFYAILQITDENGNIFDRKVKLDNLDSERNKDIFGKKLSGNGVDVSFKAGDGVFHLFGTNNLVVLPEASDTTVKCAVCGRINPVENNECSKCGHTLVKELPL